MFGSHLSVAGGMHLAVTQALSLGLDCVQVFTKNQQQWKAPPLDPAAVEQWKAAINGAGWTRTQPGTGPRVVSHASYLINLASPDPELAAKSRALMGEEIDRCEALGIELLVFHPGSFTTGTLEQGLVGIADACASLLRERPSGRTVLCLENVVGAGATIGGPFEQLAALKAMTTDRGAPPSRVGFCIDTCHAHSFGYDCSTRDAAQACIDTALSVLGQGSIRCLHLNDSMTPMGSKRDRHEHIGEGSIGAGPMAGPTLGGFAAFVNEPAFANIPKIMETPKGQRARKPKGATGAEALLDFDSVNVARLRSLIDPAHPAKLVALGQVKAVKPAKALNGTNPSPRRGPAARKTRQ